MVYLLSALSFAILVVATPVHSAGAPTAAIRNGTYQGVRSYEYDQDFFLGMAYAQPPLRNLRFRQARSLNTTWTGTREATSYSPLCVGYGLDQTFYTQSEDCLTINVIRPVGYENQTLPVGVWIHGGGYVNGGGGDQRYNQSFIVDQSVKIGRPFIGVSFNYRLHGWGFLGSRELASEGLTNIGYHDQRLALHWVQENIGAFNGDASKVTIWGESAGAASVGLHLTAYGGRDDGLFRAAIMQSGNPIFYSAQKNSSQYQNVFDQLVGRSGCNNTLDKVDCLRQLPFERLNATMGALYLEYGGLNPSIDNDIIRGYGSVQLSRGEFVKVPIITGANSDEGASFSAQGINDTSAFRATLSSISVPNQDKILALYPDSLAQNVVASLGDQRPALPYGSQFRRSATYQGDYVFIAARRQTAATWAAHGLSAYAYRFNAIPHGVPPEIGAGHFKEIGYVFRNFLGVGNRPDIKPFEGMPEGHFELSRLMSSSWASFIHDLDPNGWNGRPRDVEAWPKYDGGNPLDFVFDANVTSHAEGDSWRKEGIDWINQNAARVYSR
ncbi:carboxylesterase family protein-like protein [Lophiostoma macrostomum CBS 122681]|uniref:Carboxylesterase family protein-like protein n=1 Tax=Lophiostoma macrostomum CBS 122681 TaxID=1314788 RepID=A0A6A6SSB4_9PLEO|nr:carboxylesterase family protein-like protein [Lophiostoma macrostomum CBS 122681]